MSSLAGNESQAGQSRCLCIRTAILYSWLHRIVKKSFSYLARVYWSSNFRTWKTSKPNRRVFVKIGKSYARYVRVRRARRQDYSFSSISWLSAPSRVDSCSSTSGSSMFCPARLIALRAPRCTWIIRAIRPHAVAHIPPKIA